MIIVSYVHHEKHSFGALLEGQIYDIPEALDTSATLADWIREGRAFPDEATCRRVPGLLVGEVRLTAPMPEAARVFCLGKNYLAHAKESQAIATNEDTPQAPIYFSKLCGLITTSGDPIMLSQLPTETLDYEVELAFIMGKGGRDIPREDALSHIVGYAVANDFSARDLQQSRSQWLKGKSLDGFMPMSAEFLLAREEIPTFSLSLTVNGELRQQATTDQLIFDIPTIVEDLSRGQTLLPGDIILTGTPAGVALGMKPPVYLKPGDVVVARVDGIGAIETPIR